MNSFDFKYDIFEKNVNTQYYEEPDEKIYEKYFQRTFPLKKIIEYKNYIIDLKDEKGKEIGRKYLKNDQTLGYEEYFIFKDLQFFSQINKNITIIFPPNGEKNLDKVIGFRFYDKDPRIKENNINYFTLVLKDERKYDILEKNSKIKDGDGKLFIDIKLNCLSIIMKIIEKKYTDEVIYEFPSTSVELLGFYYSIMLEKQTKIKFIEPFFPVIDNKSTMKEAIKEENNDIIYVEPLFFNQHVSVLYFTFMNKIRYNYLVDFSLYHSNSILSDNAVFPNNMRSNLFIFPKNIFQSGPTCSIWFVSQIILALNHGSDIFNKSFDYKYINHFCNR